MVSIACASPSGGAVDRRDAATEGVSVTDGVTATDDVAAASEREPKESVAAPDPAATARRRPQDPRPPFPYASREIASTHEHLGIEITLAGTLTIPVGEGPFATAVLISGSGAHDRDGAMWGHRWLAVWADYLTRRGIAVLRLDDRGVGRSRGGETGATTQDYARDVEAAVIALTKEPHVDPSRIGLVGHSEGGLVAIILGARRTTIAFVVLLATSGVPGAEVIQAQISSLARADASPAWIAGRRANQQRVAELMARDLDDATLRQQLHALLQELGPDPRRPIDDTVDRLAAPWWRFYYGYDPRTDLAAIDRPVLVLHGERDRQVLAEQNVPAIAGALASGGNADVTVFRFADLNHLFQHAPTGRLSEYAALDETVAAEALEAVAGWILARAP